MTLDTNPYVSWPKYRLKMAQEFVVHWQEVILDSMLADCRETDMIFAHIRIRTWQTILAEAMRDIILRSSDEHS